MKRLTKLLFFILVVKPLVLIMLGLNLRHREKLPLHGPAVVVANHNSHLDTLVLMSLFPLSKIHRIRPVAAADYFLKSGFMAWVSKYLIDIVPLDRTGNTPREEIFKTCHDALDKNDILILFPEGSRGEPEVIGEIKKGLYYLLQDRNETPVIPVVMHGLGTALPKGEALFVPYNCDVIVGDNLPELKSADDFVETLHSIFTDLSRQCLTRTIS